MFADNVVISCESSEEVDADLETWRYALERRGLKVCRSKTDYLCPNRDDQETTRVQGIKMVNVDKFRHLRSMVQMNRECANEVKKRVQVGRNGWRRVTGLIFG